MLSSPIMSTVEQMHHKEMQYKGYHWDIRQCYPAWVCSYAEFVHSARTVHNTPPQVGFQYVSAEAGSWGWPDMSVVQWLGLSAAGPVLALPPYPTFEPSWCAVPCPAMLLACPYLHQRARNSTQGCLTRPSGWYRFLLCAHVLPSTHIWGKKIE